MNRVGEWARRGWVLVVVAVLPWLVAPGAIQPDTKTDLTISPARYLLRALTAWNDHAGLGELQNQAYGYLFPMGPVFVIGHWLQLPAWMTQRLWWSILLVVACAGVMRLVGRLGIATPQGAAVAGVGYALSARVLTVLANNSVEAWPMAVAPWLVVAALPLTALDPSRRQRWHAAAATGLLTTALGGVNAVASATVLVLPALFLLTHPIGRRRLGWWAGGTALGALWWVLPLLVLGRYAYPFLDFIETSSLTTAVTSAPNTLRGTNDWVAFILDADSHPVWQSGWVLAQTVVAILATCAVAGLGIVGVFRLRGHLGRWALLSVLIGALVMVVGHDGVIGSPVAGPVRALLDGVLAPLRNVHKADPLIRLPLCIGLGVLWSAWQRSGQRRIVLRRFGIGALVLVAATPVWVGRLGDAAAYPAVPGPWSQVASSVDAAAARDGGSTLVLPAARTAQFVWGKTTDEPLSALATSPVVARAAAPLGQPGATRLLDRVDLLAASGAAQPQLAPALARMGIRRVVVRHDVASAAVSEPAGLVERTLTASAGFTRVATYGSGDHQVSLWQVSGTLPSSYPDSLTVAGAPEATTDLLATGLLGQDSAAQFTTAKDARVVTDTARWRAYNNGVPAQNAFTPTLPASDRSPTRVGALDLDSSDDPADHTTRVFAGYSSVSATSDASDPFADGYYGPSAAPWSALDGDPDTAWRTTDDTDGTATLTFTIDPTVQVDRLTVLLETRSGATLPDSVEVSMPGWAGMAEHPGATVAFDVPGVRAGPVTVTLHGPADRVMGIREITVPGAVFGTSLRVPGSVDADRQRVLLTRDARQRIVDARGGDDPATLRRTFTVRVAGNVGVRAWVSVADKAALLATGGRLTCGQAGFVTVDGSRVPLAAGFTAAQIDSGATVEATPCTRDAPVLAVGTATVVGEPGTGVQTQRILLSPASGAAPPTASRTMTTGQGANAGWAARLDGRSLSPVTIDGWQQGFVLPAETPPSAVVVGFAPNLPHRVGLLAGAAAVLLLLAAWVLTRGPAPVYQRAAATGWPIAAVVVAAGAVGILTSSWWGILAAVVALAVPARYRGPAAALSLVLSGVLLSAFGVVDRFSFGAISGQLIATVPLALVAARWASGDAPSAATVAPPDTPTPTRPAG